MNLNKRLYSMENSDGPYIESIEKKKTCFVYILKTLCRAVQARVILSYGF